MQKDTGKEHQQTPHWQEKTPRLGSEEEAISEVHHLYFPLMTLLCLSVYQGTYLTPNPPCMSPDGRVLSGDSGIAQSCFEFTSTLTQPPRRWSYRHQPP